MEKDNDNGITMLEVLEEEKKLETDAIAVLGASDDKNCTYPKGYMKRQALYACLTCVNTRNTFAGVCLACSYVCHEDHDLIELYTKRCFRCDCGNSKFNGKVCHLFPNKDPENVDNKYNQNFHGLYCICHRPYPDPEDEINDEMIQCVLCEDWYHGRRLVCEKCPNCLISLVLETKSNEAQPSNDPCSMKSIDVQNLYAKHGICYILDEEDSVKFYEEQGKKKGQSCYEMELKALDSLGRVRKVEALHEYNELKDELMEYLRSFAENKKMVREEDIINFFTDMKAKKKQCLPVHVSSTCK